MVLTASKVAALKPKIGKNGRPLPITKIKDSNNLYLYLYLKKDTVSK